MTRHEKNQRKRRNQERINHQQTERGGDNKLDNVISIMSIFMRGCCVSELMRISDIAYSGMPVYFVKYGSIEFACIGIQVTYAQILELYIQ